MKVICRACGQEIEDCQVIGPKAEGVILGSVCSCGQDKGIRIERPRSLK